MVTPPSSPSSNRLHAPKATLNRSSYNKYACPDTHTLVSFVLLPFHHKCISHPTTFLQSGRNVLDPYVSPVIFTSIFFPLSFLHFLPSKFIIVFQFLYNSWLHVLLFESSPLILLSSTGPNLIICLDAHVLLLHICFGFNGGCMPVQKHS